LDKIIKHKYIINFISAQRLGCLGHIEKMQKKKQYVLGNPFQEGQQEDQRYAGRMMLEKIYRSQKCQIGGPLSRIEEDGRNWLRRPKLCIKSCRATKIIIRKNS